MKRLLAAVNFSLLSAAVALALGGARVRAQCAATVLTSDLRFPSGVVLTPLGNLLVAENGAAEPNTGRVSIVGPDGARRTLLDGLPSGFNEVVGPAGPSGLLLRGRTLYVAVGVGDATLAGPLPGTEVPNPQASSPIFDSILAVRFGAAAETETQGFTLTPADHLALAAGEELRLGGGSGRVTVELIADFPDFVPDPQPFFPENVRHSNPYHLVAKGNRLYVSESGLNSVVEVDINTGTFSTLATFAPLPNPLPFGPPAVDAVATGIALDDGRLLVSLLTGFPFPPGASEVRAVEIGAGTQSAFFTGLTSAIDVLPVREGGDTDYLVLEFSADLLANLPGRLLRFETPGGAPTVVSDCLVSPSAMTRDRRTGTLYVTETFTGRVVTLPVE
ncbi:MAG TPA: ScyD/ScyE family protein [Pyrinomonadaceae bacterium]|nr:ScyD/ScyE family protein [Pyrinomonadaceae bacterium]